MARSRRNNLTQRIVLTCQQTFRSQTRWLATSFRRHEIRERQPCGAQWPARSLALLRRVSTRDEGCQNENSGDKKSGLRLEWYPLWGYCRFRYQLSNQQHLLSSSFLCTKFATTCDLMRTLATGYYLLSARRQQMGCCCCSGILVSIRVLEVLHFARRRSVGEV